VSARQVAVRVGATVLALALGSLYRPMTPVLIDFNNLVHLIAVAFVVGVIWEEFR
jgi:hypothetical protein